MSASLLPESVIFHADMDAFYTSIEQRDNSELKGKPVIVGSKLGTRGVVSAASYEARAFGVFSAMPINEAYRKCPGGIYIQPRMSHYLDVSRKLMEILKSFTPQIEPLSVDEAFMDMTGTSGLWGSPLEAATTLQNSILNQLQLTCSIGIARNKFLAKLGSDIKKPFGITLIPFKQSDLETWLAPLPVKKLWGAGKVTQKKMLDLNIHTFLDLQNKDDAFLTKHFNNYGNEIFSLVRGHDTRIVQSRESAKSVSREHTFEKDEGEHALWKKVLLTLSSDVAQKCRKDNLQGTTVVFSWRETDFSRHSKQKKMNFPTNSTQEIYKSVMDLIKKSGIVSRKIRLIGVGLTGFQESLQTSLLDIPATNQRMEKSERTMDVIIQKFGKNAIQFGGEFPPS